MSIGCVFLAIFTAAGSGAALPLSNESYGGAAVEPRRVQSGVGPPPRSQSKQRQFLIGASVTKQGSKFPNGVVCHYCLEADAGMRFFTATVNKNDEMVTRDGEKIVIKLKQLHDDGSYVQVEQNYEELAAYNQGLTPGELPMLALFGPSWVGFNAIAARIANESNIVLITWAFNYGNYFSAPGPVMRMGVHNNAYQEAQRIWNGGCTGTGCSLLQQRTNDAFDIQFTAFGSGYDPTARRLQDIYEDIDLDGEVWMQNYTNLLDINVPQSRWGYNAIEKVQTKYLETRRSQRPQDIAFCYVTLPGSEAQTNYRSCKNLHDYAVDKYADSVMASLFEVKDLMKDVTQLWSDDHDVLVLCGDLWHLVQLTIGFKAYSMAPKTVLYDKPMQQFFSAMTKGFNALYFLDVLPMTYDETQECLLFENFNRFLKDMAAHLNQCCSFDVALESVGYASMQTAAAGVLILSAMRWVKTEKLINGDEDTTEALMNHFRENTITTFWGDLSFHGDGKRIATGMTRQFEPFPMLGYAPTGRYKLMRFKIVDEYKASQCPEPEDDDEQVLSAEDIRARQDLFISDAATQATAMQNRLSICPYTERVYPALGWTEKELQVYPCAPGCYYVNEKCHACPRGRFRSAQFLGCLSCPPGQFAHVHGLSACFDCPEHGNCQQQDMTPLPQENYYPLPLRGNNISLEDDLQWQAGAIEEADERMCVAPDRQPNMVKFEVCNSANICSGQHGRLVTGYEYLPLDQLDSTCRGDNRGVLCGQCTEGYTHYGFRAGLRVCAKCDSYISLLIRAFIFLALFAVMGKIIANAAYNSANRVSCLMCPLLRCLIQFLQLAGFMFEAVSLDTDEYTSYLVIPFEIFIRPFDAAQIQCLRENSNSITGIQDLKSESFSIIPISILLILAFHCIKSLLRYSKFVFKCLNKLILVVAKCFSPLLSIFPGSGGDDDDDEDDSKKKNDIKQKKSESPAPTSPTSPRSPKGEEDTEYDQAEHEAAILAALKNRPQEDIKEKPYSLVYGPGQAFASMHEGFALQGAIEIICGEMVAMLILLYPVVLRITFMVNVCRDLYPNGVKEERLLANFDILCGTPNHEAMRSGVSMMRFLLGFALPIFLMFFNFWAQDWVFSLRFRRIFAIFYAGYKPNYFYWQIIILWRNLLIFYAAGMAQQWLYKCFLLSCVLGVSLVLMLVCHPYDRNDREVLHTLEKYIHLVLILTVWIGYVAVKLQLGLGDEDELGLAELILDISDSIWLRRSLGFFAILCNYFVVFCVFGAMLYNQVSLPLQAIISQSNTDASGSSLWFHKFVKYFFRGMNELCYLKNKIGLPLMDIKQLDESERRFLTESITETMSACIDSGKIFHTWLLQNAIDAAFQRAAEARNAKLRHLYERHGMRNFPLLSLGPLSAFYVTLRPPDIKTDIKSISEGTGKAGDKKLKMKLGDSLKVHQVGVTVEEFHTALSSVNVDILSRHPDLFQQPGRKFLDRKEEAQEAMTAQEIKSVVYWYEGSSLQYLVDRLQTAGTLEVQRGTTHRPHDDPDADYFLKLIQGEAEEMKEKYNATLLAPGEELLGLEDHLKSVEQEAKEKMEQLQTSDKKDFMEDLSSMEAEINHLKELLKVHHHDHRNTHRHILEEDPSRSQKRLTAASAKKEEKSDDAAAALAPDDAADAYDPLTELGLVDPQAVQFVGEEVATESRPKAEAKARASPKASPESGMLKIVPQGETKPAPPPPADTQTEL